MGFLVLSLWEILTAEIWVTYERYILVRIVYATLINKQKPKSQWPNATKIYFSLMQFWCRMGTSPGEWSLSFCLPFQKPLALPRVNSCGQVASYDPKFLQVSENFLNFVNKSLSSINTSCCSAIALYYLWLLLLSEFIAIISQQPSWHSQPAICHPSPWWKAEGRTWAVTQHPKLWMTQSSWRAGEIVIKKEREGERGEKREARTNEGDQAPCENSGSQSLRNERETLPAEPGTKHWRDWLPPEQPSFTINSQRRYTTKVCFLQSQKQLHFLTLI